jgi:hypothetical protein
VNSDSQCNNENYQGFKHLCFAASNLNLKRFTSLFEITVEGRLQSPVLIDSPLKVIKLRGIGSSSSLILDIQSNVLQSIEIYHLEI